MSLPIRRLLLCIAIMLAAATAAAANDVADACHEFRKAEVIFIGRVKSAPIMRRMSGEARAAKDAAPVDLSLTPLIVETAFRGVTTPELFMWNQGQPDLDPARSYLFYADRPMGPLVPDVIRAGRPKELEAAEADVRFLHEAAASDQGTIVHGSLTFQDPDNHRRRTPIPGVLLRLSLDGQSYETSTGVDGTFTITGVPPGLLRIEPVLPDHLTLPAQQAGGMVKGGCLAVHLRATINGRVGTRGDDR
jgi:hypothetical protein